MKYRNKFICLVLPLFTLGLATHVNATLLDFEFGSTGSSILSSANQGYGGFTWDGTWVQYDTGTYQSTFGNTGTAPSGDEFVFNSGGIITASATQSAFDLTSAYFSTWASNGAFGGFSSTSVTVNGYLGATLVGSVTQQLTTDFAFMDIGLSNIDRFDVVNDGGSGRWWLMDDLVINENLGSVPAPATLLLFSIGLAGLGWSRRRQKS